MNNSLEVFYDKSSIQIRLALLFCLLVLAPILIGNLLVNYYHDYYSATATVPVIIFIAECFLFAYYYLIELCVVWYKKYTFKKPVFIVDDKGITDKMGYNSVGFIPWNNIKRVGSFSATGYYLVIFVDDENAIIGKFKKEGKRRKVARDFKKNGSNIRIAVIWLDENIFTLKKFAQAKLEEHKTNRL